MGGRRRLLSKISEISQNSESYTRLSSLRCKRGCLPETLNRSGDRLSACSFAIRWRPEGECTNSMSRPARGPVAGARFCMFPKLDAAIDYRRLQAALASRARWLGSQDPEG